MRGRPRSRPAHQDPRGVSKQNTAGCPSPSGASGSKKIAEQSSFDGSAFLSGTTRGLAVSYGLERDVRDAYAFLMQQFEPDDALFMFGFSRGAYTARAVASLLHMYGLLPAGNEPLIPYAIRMMNATNRQKSEAAFELADDFRATFRGTANRISSAFGTPSIRSDGSKIP
jgi:hypothetical protein